MSAPVGLAGRLPAWLQRGGLMPARRRRQERSACSPVTPRRWPMPCSNSGLPSMLRDHKPSIDEFVVPGDLAEFFVPVIARLAGSAR